MSASPVGGRGRVLRAGWFVGGWIAVALGGVGIVVPGLPTTVFFIIAASCFGKSSPRFERWVLGLPRIGRMVQDHRAGLGMPRRAKRAAIVTMWVAIGLSSLALRHVPIALTVVIGLGLVGTTYIVWRVPTRERVHVSTPDDAGSSATDPNLSSAEDRDEQRRERSDRDRGRGRQVLAAHREPRRRAGT